MVDQERRRIIAPIFAQLIRGEVWDTEYMARESEVRDGCVWHDEAVEEALVWGDLLTMEPKATRYLGNRALPPELLMRLEALVRVLESDDEYTPGNPYTEMQRINRLYPYVPTSKDLLWGIFYKPIAEWCSDLREWIRKNKQ